MLKRSSRARLLFDRAVLHVPLVGGMLRLYHVSNSARTLGLLLSSGVTLSEAVLIAAEATQSLVYQEALAALSTSVARGERLSLRLMEQPHLFPPTLCHLVAVGERSGTLPETLLYVADLYDNEVDEFAKNISTLIEPALMVCMGLLVGFIAVSIITPIYAITQNLHT